MLLERDDVDPNIPNTETGRTPLSLAARRGSHEGIVRMLLARPDTDPNLGGPQSLTPLEVAVSYGHEC